MNVTAPVVAKANVLVEVFSAPTGEKLSESRHHNMAVNAGLDQIRDYLFGDTPMHPTHGAVGTGTTPTAATDTTLETEVFRDVIAARVKGNQALTIQFVVGSTQANGSTLTEVGLFNDASAGTMYARVVISPVNKTALISLLVTWTLSWSSS